MSKPVFNPVKTKRLIELNFKPEEFDQLDDNLPKLLTDGIVKTTFLLTESQLVEYKSIDITKKLYELGAYYVYPPVVEVVKEQQRYLDVDENHYLYDDPFDILEEFVDEKAPEELHSDILEKGKQILSEVMYD